MWQTAPPRVLILPPGQSEVPHFGFLRKVMLLDI
jgi:hypothetical protein